MKKIILTFFLFAFVYANLQAQWPSNKNSPINVALAQETELVKQVINDGEGGVYVVWEKHYGNNVDLHIARYNSQGNLLLSYPIYASPLDERLVGIMSDGSGGVFIVWAD